MPCTTARRARRSTSRSSAARPTGLTIVIRDRWPGVPSGDLERIFQPFYRVAESRDRGTRGEGIGLAITSQVMKTHGGSAKACALEGGGLEVRLNLPPAAVAA